MLAFLELLVRERIFDEVILFVFERNPKDIAYFCEMIHGHLLILSAIPLLINCSCLKSSGFAYNDGVVMWFQILQLISIALGNFVHSSSL